MLRIRQVPQGMSQAAFARLSIAVALSATLHLYLIFGLALRPAHGPADRVSIINSRLLPEYGVPTQTKPAAPATRRSRILHAQSQVPTLPEPAEAPVPATEALLTSDHGPEAEIATVSLPDPIYYAARDLDVYPQPLKRIEHVYPQTERAADTAGSVTLLLLVDESGRVADVSVVDASPRDVFEESALRALATTTYSPAQKNGRAVRSRILVQVDYVPIAAVAPR